MQLGSQREGVAQGSLAFLMGPNSPPPALGAAVDAMAASSNYTIGSSSRHWGGRGGRGGGVVAHQGCGGEVVRGRMAIEDVDRLLASLLVQARLGWDWGH